MLWVLYMTRRRFGWVGQVAGLLLLGLGKALGDRILFGRIIPALTFAPGAVSFLFSAVVAAAAAWIGLFVMRLIGKLNCGAKKIFELFRRHVALYPSKTGRKISTLANGRQVDCDLRSRNERIHIHRSVTIAAGCWSGNKLDAGAAKRIGEQDDSKTRNHCNHRPVGCGRLYPCPGAAAAPHDPHN